MKKILLLGGYGNFGKRIARSIAKQGMGIIIAGRNTIAADALEKALHQEFPATPIETACFDADLELDPALEKLKPYLVINTCGPFQSKQYTVAVACIKHGIHYIDLADGRDFVTGISQLDKQAQAAGVSIISGASTVPGLSSAVLESYRPEFSRLESLTYGISPGQKADRGLATTEGILSYVGKALAPYKPDQKKRYGWQDIYQQPYPLLGKRWMANCDVPDLDLFPKHYGIEDIRFSAGMESSLLHLGIWCLSWLVRAGLPLNLKRHARWLLRMSHWFDCLGTADGGMHMSLSGQDKHGKNKTVRWFIIATHGDGPEIPIIPAVILARKIVSGEFSQRGAMPCVGLVNLTEYLEELKDFRVETHTEQ